MPWFPDFASTVELTRRQTRAAGKADPVAQYFAALNEGDSRALETVWPGEVVIYDPRAGEVRGHKQVRRFIRLRPASTTMSKRPSSTPDRPEMIMAARQRRCPSSPQALGSGPAAATLCSRMVTSAWRGADMSGTFACGPEPGGAAVTARTRLSRAI